jgi:phosphoribosylanthranilate isomerase
MIVKVCGITTASDAEAAIAAGADWIGLNFWPRSRRHVTAERAREILEVIPGDVKKVGVFVNAPAPQVLELASVLGLDLIQLHGDESAEFARGLARPVMRAVRVAAAADLRGLDAWPGEHVLLDAPSAGYGGSGQTFDWQLARNATTGKKLLLAGGLDDKNVAQAIRLVRPYGVDVASGVERTPGVKDHDKLRRFIDAAKNGNASRGTP